MATRRATIVGLLALPLAASTASLVWAQPVPVVRRRVGTLATDANLRTLVRGIRIMKGQDSEHPVSREIAAQRGNHPFSWLTQMRIHSGNWGQHGSWRFLPWHRAQLRLFEQTIGYLTGTPAFALPYWDPREHRYLPIDLFNESSPLFWPDRNWESRHLPPEFLEPGSRLFSRDRNWGIRQLNFLGAIEEVTPELRNRGRYFAALADGNVKRFMGSTSGPGDVEYTTHNLIHELIGGRMGMPWTATLDPLFWLHHANVDRVWASWQSAHAASASEAYPSALVQEELRGFQQNRPILAADVLSIQDLGYIYDRQYTLPEFAPLGDLAGWEIESKLEPRLLASDNTASAELGKPAHIRFEIPAELRPLVSPASKTIVKSAELALSIDRKSFAQFSVRISLRSSSGPDSPSICRLISPFGFDNHHAGGSAGMSFHILITAQLAAILEQGNGVDVIVEAVPRANGVVLPAEVRVLSASIEILSYKLRRT